MHAMLIEKMVMATYCVPRKEKAATVMQKHEQFLAVLMKPLLGFGSLLLTTLALSIAVIEPSKAQSQNKAVVEMTSCGTSCRQYQQQIGPVSRTRYGYPRVPVSVIKTLVPDSNAPFLGWKYGHRVVKTSSGTYPKLTKYWFVADCKRRQMGMYAKDSDGADAIWQDADGHHFVSQSWHLLCAASGEL
jgi:hypothetical protein